MRSDLKNVQRADMAGRTKLTAVTIGHGRYRRQFFVMLQHDIDGTARLPQATLDRILDQAGVRRGDTYTVS